MNMKYVEYVFGHLQQTPVAGADKVVAEWKTGSKLRPQNFQITINYNTE
jgi:hypothetical protein